jgi:quercetin dioxygenase-like cupin family protein
MTRSFRKRLPPRVRSLIGCWKRGAANMSQRSASFVRVCGVGMVFGMCISFPATAAEAASSMQGVIQPLESAQFTPDDDVKCLSDVLETGDPAKGPSTVLLKAPPGCLVRWHYHTAMEQVTVIRGQVKIEMTGHGPVTLGAGGFAAMPGKMAHQFVCRGKQECLMLVTFDGAYDIFWGKGN